MSLDLHHLGAAYVLDALEPHERSAFEAHMPQCSICIGDVADYRTTAAALALATRHTPPDALRPRVMDQITQTRQLQRVPQVLDRRVQQPHAGPRSGRSTRLLAGIAALVSLMCLAIIGWPNEDTSAPLATTSEAIVTTLDARAETASGLLQVVWLSGREDVVVIGSGLADPGDDLAYELWLHGEDGVVAPVGLFSPINGVVTTMLAVDDAMPSTWSVSLEPSTGSPQPTGAVLYGEPATAPTD